MAVLARPSSPANRSDLLLEEIKGHWTAAAEGGPVQTVAAWQRPEGRYELVFHRNLGVPAGVLTHRELEVAALVTEGLSNKMIAAHMGISTWTVGTYVRRIFQKLTVSSRAAMVARLMRQA